MTRGGDGSHTGDREEVALYAVGIVQVGIVFPVGSLGTLLPR